MKERIKQIRKEAGLTQQKFADALMLSKGMVEALEYGRSNPTDRVVADICRVFHINEQWLRTGAGEKNISKEELIADVTTVMADNLASGDYFHNALIQMVASLNKDEIDVLREKLEALFTTKKNSD